MCMTTYWRLKYQNQQVPWDDHMQLFFFSSDSQVLTNCYTVSIFILGTIPFFFHQHSFLKLHVHNYIILSVVNKDVENTG